MTYEELTKNISLLTGGGIIIGQSIIGSLLGFWYGQFRRELEDDSTQSREKLAQPWERAYSISDIGDEVTVITTQNREVRGEIQQMGSPSEDQDILLESPVEIQRNERGETTLVREIGQYSYHHYRDIARVEFGAKEEELYDPEGGTKGVKSIREQVSLWWSAFKKSPPIQYLTDLDRNEENEEDSDKQDIELTVEN